MVAASLISPSTAGAAPPGFPDVDAFAAVSLNGYIIYRDSDKKVVFSTVDGVRCSWKYIMKQAENPAFFTAPHCSGTIPGIPESVPDNGGPGCARVWSVFPDRYGFDRHLGVCPPFPSKVLNPGQKLETGNMTCVVGEDALVACIDPTKDHGFVLQPSGSRVF